MPGQIATAFVTVRPDSRAFAPELTAQLRTAVTGIQVPAAGGLTDFREEAAGARKELTGMTAASVVAARGAGDLGAKAGAGAAGLGNLARAGAAAGAGFLGVQAGARLAVGAVTSSVSSFADLEAQLNVFRVVTGATADQMERARQVARELGADVSLPGVSAGDSARALVELGKSGVAVEDSLEGVRGVLQLATAGELDVAAAAQIAGSALNAFRLQGEQTSHVADLLAGASAAAQGDVGDMALAFQQSAAVANQAGLSIEQLVGLITELARQGILGSDAGTSIRTMLLRLAPTTKEAAQFQEALGIRLDQTRTIGQQLPDVLDQYRASLARLSPIQRQQALTQIFGTDAIRSATIATQEGARGLQIAIDASNKAGAANELAGARTKGLAGDFAALRSSVENLGTDFGQALEPGASDFARALTFVANQADAAVVSVQRSGNALEGFRAGRSTQEISRQLVNLREILESNPRSTFAQAAIPFLENVLRSRLSPALRQVATDVKGFQRSIVDAAERNPSQTLVSDVADKVAGLSPVFQGAGEEAGSALGRGIADGIKSEEEIAVAAAQRTLKEVIRQGNIAITQSVEDAKSNLASIGSTLAAQVGQLIDVGPLGTRIKAIQDDLAGRTAARTRAGLVEDLHEATIAMKEAQIEAGPLGDRLRGLKSQLEQSQAAGARSHLASDLAEANRELARAQAAVAGIGTLNAEQARGATDFLRPFEQRARAAAEALRENRLSTEIDHIGNTIQARKDALRGDPLVDLRQNIADAENAIRDFDSNALLTGLQKAAQAQKDTVTRGVADIIAEFNRGGISMAQANGRIAALIGKNVGPWQTAGKKLGTSFNAEFIATVEGLQEQLEAIVLGPQRPGTTGTRPRVQRPQDTVQSVARDTQAARDALAKAQLDATQGPGGTNDLLRQIRDALKPAPTGKGRTGTGVR